MQQMMATNPEQYLSTNQPRTTAHCLTRNVRKSTLTKDLFVDQQHSSATLRSLSLSLITGA